MIIKPPNIKIEQPDKNHLVLHIKPIFIYCLIILPIGLALILFLVSLYAPYSINLSCDRYQSGIPSTINCQLVKRDLWGIRKQEREIVANNYQSTIENFFFEGSSIPDYNVILLADKKRIKITTFDQFSPNYNLWKKQNKQINEFLNGNNTNYHLEVGENNFSVIFTCFKLSAMLVIISAIILGVKIDITYTLSKELNILSIRRYNFLTEIVREISLDEIENIFLEKNKGTENSTSRIVFQLKSGENIALTSWLDSFDGKGKIVKRIRQFLS